MVAITDTTTLQNGGNKFHFVCAKRTFSMLSSPNFPKYTENLMCEEIVLKMGLQISNRKCEPLSINGVKTEAVGIINTTVQRLQHGSQAGTIHMRAKVVRDFYKMFGSDGLCSDSLDQKLTIGNINSSRPKKKTEPTDSKPSSVMSFPSHPASNLTNSSVQTPQPSTESPVPLPPGFSTPSPARVTSSTSCKSQTSPLGSTTPTWLANFEIFYNNKRKREQARSLLPRDPSTSAPLHRLPSHHLLTHLGPVQDQYKTT